MFSFHISSQGEFHASFFVFGPLQPCLWAIPRPGVAVQRRQQSSLFAWPACREPDLADVGDGRNPNCFLCQAIRSPLTYPPSHHQHRLISVAAHHLQVHFGAGLRLFPHTASIALLDHPLGSTCRRSCDIPPFLNRRSSFSHYNQFSRRPCTARRIQRPSTEYYRPLSFL